MNWQKIQRQLIREATANPKKAAFLGVLCVVCLYFWAPLVWGWVAGPKSKGGKSKMSDPRSIVASPSAQVTPGADTVSAADTETSAFDWQKADQLLSQDPYAVSLAPSDVGSDPFVAAVLPKREPSEEPAQQVLTPDQLGLTLSSTFLGRDRRVALINGRAYREGQTLKVAGHRLRIAEVGRDHVILVGSSVSMRLAIDRPGAASSDDSIEPPGQTSNGAEDSFTPVGVTPVTTGVPQPPSE